MCGGYLAHGESFCQRYSIRQDLLVGGILEAIQRTYGDPATIKRLRVEMQKVAEAEQSRGDLSRIKQQIAALDQKLARARNRLVDVPDDLYDDLLMSVRRLKQQRDGLAASFSTIPAHATMVKMSNCVGNYLFGRFHKWQMSRS